MDNVTPLDKAISRRGGIPNLASDLGVTRQAIYYWQRAGVPAIRAIEIERLTGVSRAELRPDLFGEAAA